ncbi:bifunctional 5,10-methylenetetrahydrofolate dehydrogenase/5,10-methenyltetrahydrofolate cyclohydrolase [Thalassovita gelatinovora]|nr:bifunctional 5,10-methylenetetrahydrofolate dehydrogenase/5,10-methenyltetrahydrofolate cyclohydrolase [Thalassovita gelatinovora]
MQARILDGDALAARLRENMKTEVAGLKSRGIQPKLVTILVGDNPDSATYIGRKHADCTELGIDSVDIRLQETTTEVELMALVADFNADPAVQGLMVQIPLPEHLDDDAVKAAVLPEKDIDGLHPENLGRLLAGNPGLISCTPDAILTLLRAYDVPLAGRNVTIVGRGQLVGRPLAMLLSMKGIDADVTLLHSHSTDIPARLREADVIVAACGQPGFVTADMVKPGAAVVGVGITYDASGAMMSDVAQDVAGVAGWVTPPHGSVGPLTRAMLLKNLLIAAG